MLLRSLFGKDPESVGVIMGLDASGKTTLLYRMLRAEIITTIPTIGFNVETVHRNGLDLTFWDVGGCDRIRPLIKFYLGNERFILFLHDCSDPRRWDESITEIKYALDGLLEMKGTHCFIAFNKQDTLPPDTRDEVIRNLQGKVELATESYRNRCHVEIIEAPGLSGITGDGIEVLLAWIQQILSNKPAKMGSPTTPPKAIVSAQPPTKDELLKRIESAQAAADGVETFWAAFLKADLTTWDHFTHLRAGYLVMLEEVSAGKSILDCPETFLGHLANLKSTHPDRFRNTAHKTMTIFWLLQLQYAALKYDATQHGAGYPPRGAFHLVLRDTPELMNPGLWKEYYTKDLLFTPEARGTWHPPNLKPLPAVVTIRPFSSHEMTASEEDPSDIVLQFALTVVQTTYISKAKRGRIVKAALDTLQTSIMQRRSRDSSIPPYSETQAYFWVQYFHAAAASMDKISPLRESDETRDGSISSLDLPTFKLLFGITGTEWRKFYSVRVWESVAARMEFRVPDKQPLPDIL